MKRRLKLTLQVSPWTTTAVAITWAGLAYGLSLSSAQAASDAALKELGKHVFFDPISIPGNKQACASCHDPAKGWILPNSAINSSTVVAPGAKPHATGNIKPPSNAYASFSPPFRPAGGFSAWEGGNFWDGRAEGYGAPGADGTPHGDGAISETITVLDLGANTEYAKYLGPTADQALNPFPNDVEQNIREKNVCQRVKTAKYKDLYVEAFGEPIDCRPNPKSSPAYKTSYKRIAVALAAWQASEDVNSFSSKRDEALAADPDGKFPLEDFTPEENLGHDLFYGLNDTGRNTGGRNGGPKNARCTACHNGVPEGEASDPRGEALHQLYTDNAYRNIGTPFNREIPGVAKGEKIGLAAHVTTELTGQFKTPTLRNIAKGVRPNFTKAYTHNGWFKSLKSLVHFYNTRDVLLKCEDLGITDATEEEALANDCWPAPEFPDSAAGFVIGNLGLTDEEENALVAYMKTLTDKHTPTKPSSNGTNTAGGKGKSKGRGKNK